MPLQLPLHLNWLKATLDTVLLTCSRPTRQTRLVTSVLNIKTLGYHYSNVLWLAATEPPFFHSEFCNWDQVGSTASPPPFHTHNKSIHLILSSGNFPPYFPLVNTPCWSWHQLTSQSVTSPGHFAKTACKKTCNVTLLKRGLCEVTKRCFAKWLRAIIIMNRPWPLGQDCIQEDLWCRFDEEYHTYIYVYRISYLG